MTINRRTAYIYKYLPIENKGKTSGKWKIKITNPLNSSITVSYNSKMCNYSDAMNWTALQDVIQITISANSSKEVLISENWFATAITVSYISNGHRLITYADGLSNDGTMNVYNNRI